MFNALNLFCLELENGKIHFLNIVVVDMNEKDLGLRNSEHRL